MDARLREIKYSFKECASPIANEDLDIVINHLSFIGVTNPGIPEELLQMWNLSSEWHLIHDHCNVFGFNIFGPKSLIELTNCIFDDSDIRQMWEDELGPQSCAHIDWLCFASYSEYDYIFVNLNKDSPLFGTTRHMVNNCFKEDTIKQPPFRDFIDYLDDFITNYQEEEDDTSDHEEEEY